MYGTPHNAMTQCNAPVAQLANDTISFSDLQDSVTGATYSATPATSFTANTVQPSFFANAAALLENDR